MKRLKLKVDTSLPLKAPKNKHCRICWNTNGWEKPSGTAHESKGSFAASNGFGFEEWLFNNEWCLDGHKYAFLQPINKNLNRYQGQTFSVALYTKVASRSFLVATISDVYVPRYDEWRTAFSQMKKRGWVEQMRDDIEAIGGQPVDLENPPPHQVINVRFKPDDVRHCDPMQVFPKDHIVSRRHRYQAYDWNGTDLPSIARDDAPNVSDPARSEEVYLRAAQQATQVDPKHVRLQNRLYGSFCEQYGADAVQYEQDFVDLKVTGPAGDSFFEIKTDRSAKRCIRNALGQLLEYSSYPAAERASAVSTVE